MPSGNAAMIPVETALHIFEIVSILGGGFTVAYRMGQFAQSVKDANRAFVEKMEESKVDRAVIHEEIRALSKIAADNALLDLRIAMLEKWYDELRRGIGQIEALK